MNRFALLTVAMLYYTVWLLLPVFELDNKLSMFPLPSIYAVYLPISLLLLGFAMVGTFLGVLLLLDSKDDESRSHLLEIDIAI
ncbi:hypothetical protein HG535_0A04780 [Zygotorulaspora mrakii]|uniref:Dolichol phosphate-mannose biosynthesis regulatory protein n=1 Tax=Zygotorulaspora mrakii TaxID=42260 RepID=A0A7H9AVY4_ZYGMR|nr:uncharacterized protein HG535_0A04780 [Zygotorulaspora mrakii]QLG70538.1 hypothetical protein HG535_0A04780 [Zygotorulaspora mrakii]